jgi:hypothetical protein
MPLSERELLDGFGGAAEAGNAALFIGAGMSLNAGYPTWHQLLEKPRADAQIPASLSDLPLVAQYYVQTVPGGREALENHILTRMAETTVHPDEGHALLAELPVDEIWTTNYDPLIEQMIQTKSVVSGDGDLADRRTLNRRRIIKMHGSVSADNKHWLSRPIITRSDYETYESEHPRLWAALRATYLTKSMLFLGFSFTDPNIDILLRLSRTLLDIGAPEHFTVMRRPTDANDLRLHNLRVSDLEKSGIAVYEVDEFDELNPLLSRLMRRTREKILFISGSKAEGGLDIGKYAPSLGASLANLDIDIASMAGTAAMRVSYSFGHHLKAVGKYRPERVQYFFREKEGEAPPLDERVGTAVYTALDMEQLREHVLHLSRAAVFIGGGPRTENEAELAKAKGVPVIPLACSDGAARTIWTNTSVEDSGITSTGSGTEERDWKLLNNDEPSIAVEAAVRLIRQAMYVQ